MFLLPAIIIHSISMKAQSQSDDIIILAFASKQIINVILINNYNIKTYTYRYILIFI